MSVDDAPYLGPRGFTIFCDDLREETSGKVTCVGTYSDVMYLQGDPPINLPKFCFFTHLYCSEDELFESLQLHIWMPWDDQEKPTVQVDVPLKENRNVRPDGVEKDPIFGGFHLGMKMIASPFVVERYGRIRVAAIWDGKTIPVGSLIIAGISDRNES